MAYIIELEPSRIEGSRLVPDTPEEAIVDGYADHLRNSLAALVLHPDFDPQAVPAAFVDAIDEHTPTIVAQVLKDETNWGSSDTFKKLTVKIGDLLMQGAIQDPDQVEIDSRFSDDLKQQALAMMHRFDLLGKYNQSLSTNQSLSLVHDVWRLSAEQPEGWLDDCYEMAKAAMFNPNFVPQLDDPEALYLITFMPHLARRLTRRVLVGNYMISKIRSELGNTLNEDSAAMLEAFSDYTAADALSGQHWNDAAKHFGWSDEHSVVIGLLSVQKLHALGIMQQLVKDGRGNKFIDTYKAARDGLRRTIIDVDSTAHRTGLGTWAGEDIGHCFRNFSDWDINRVIGEGDLIERDFNPAEKTGGKIVILEDDERQMAAWQQVFEEHSVFEVSPSHCFTSPEGIEAHFADPDASLFLLDIQNGQDETAGIRVAGELFRKRLTILAEAPDPRLLKPLKIVVWSSSHAATQAAHRQLSALWKDRELNPEGSDYVGYLGGGSAFTSGAHRITIEVKQKELHPRDLREADY